MLTEREKIDKAKAILGRIAEGTDPVSKDAIDQESFLLDPRMIRCFRFIMGILDEAEPSSQSKSPFTISPEQKSNIELPQEKIGVNAFCQCVNACIDVNRTKRLTGAELFKRLKKRGILGEEKTEAGRTRTVTNDASFEYGFEPVRRSRDGVA